MNVRITIRGREYTLRSDEPEEDLAAVARYVDGKMEELSRPNIDDYTVAMLAALNIASEYSRYRQRVGERLEELERDAAAVGAVLDAALPER